MRLHILNSSCQYVSSLNYFRCGQERKFCQECCDLCNFWPSTTLMALTFTGGTQNLLTLTWVRQKLSWHFFKNWSQLSPPGRQDSLSWNMVPSCFKEVSDWKDIQRSGPGVWQCFSLPWKNRRILPTVLSWGGGRWRIPQCRPQVAADELEETDKSRWEWYEGHTV